MVEPADIAARASQLQNALVILKSHGISVMNYPEVLAKYQLAFDEMVSMIHDLAVYLQPENTNLG